MKKALTLVVLALAIPAMAEIQLFWSTTGITDAGLQYSTALTNFLPALVLPTPTTGYVGVDPTMTFDLFLWGKFIETPAMPSYTQIYGLDLKFEGPGTVVQSNAYRQSKTGSGAYKRWDGSQGIQLNGVMAAVTARGIEFILPPDTNNDLYYPASQEFLIGAAQVTLAADQFVTMSLDTADGLGIAMRYIGGEDITDPPVVPANFTYTIPEPASFLLLGLAGLLIRRR